ncbi:MAG TPA: hypothetical protein VK754_10785, partial [Propionibacteriaceae bacterium]|nr:hypothetical protein [Propionibacteriaceae bacterium]
MLLSRLAETRIALTATRSRNAKRDLIAAVLRETSPEDVEIWSRTCRGACATGVPGLAGSRCSPYLGLRRK